MDDFKEVNIAVLLPCFNEELAIKAVVESFYKALPDCTVYVYDNGSTDNTAHVALRSGAIVRFEPRKGKGNVVRRMFADIEADVYILADGDLTYEADAAPKLVEKLLNEKLDMVVGTREDGGVSKAYRKGHRFGNKFFTKLVSFIFGKQFNDILSGYRAFSRRFVKSFPALAHGFDTEVELTIHCLGLKLPAAEVATKYSLRPEGAISKLNKYKDGLRILKRIVLMFKETKPLLFFALIAILLVSLSIGLAVPLFLTYFKTGLVPRIPTAVLSAAIMILAFISLTCGIVLDGVCRSRKEWNYLNYLSLPWLR